MTTRFEFLGVVECNISCGTDLHLRFSGLCWLDTYTSEKPSRDPTTQFLNGSHFGSSFNICVDALGTQIHNPDRTRPICLFGRDWGELG